jgi:tetratricopeptide (TPR) repeat protein
MWRCFPPDGKRSVWASRTCPRSTRARSWLWAWPSAGSSTRRRGVAQEALAIAEAADHPLRIAWALDGLGLQQLHQGDLSLAIPTLERGVNLCQTLQLSTPGRLAAPALGYARLHAGQVGEALTYLEPAVVEAPGMMGAAHRTRWQVWLGEGYLLAGRMQDARIVAERVLAVVRDRSERVNEAWALRLLGEIVSRSESPMVEQAERRYCEALTLAKELGMRPLVAHCHLGLGAPHRKVGRDEQARAELMSAAAMYRAMDMAFWLAKAHTVLGERAD